MYSFIEIFKKKGGLGLVRQWWNSKVLSLAFIEFLLLGKNQKGLELLREVLNYKQKVKLKKKYSRFLQNMPKHDSLEHHANKKIWIMWWQGIDKAPIVVRRCYRSVKESFPDWDITLLTENNWKEYIYLPNYIISKFHEGNIPMAQFSDMLRLQLLIEKGGLWIDSTVFVNSQFSLPHPIVAYEDTELFLYQREVGKCSNWLILAKTNNEVLIEVRDCLFEYWKRNNKLTDYFIFHRFFEIVSERHAESVGKIPFYSNSLPHILLLHLFDKYDEDFWKDLNSQTSIHKLSYKLDTAKMKMSGTYYDKLIGSE